MSLERCRASILGKNSNSDFSLLAVFSLKLNAKNGEGIPRFAVSGLEGVHYKVSASHI